LTSGDSVLEKLDVIVKSVFVDGELPGSHSVVDLFARAGLVVDLNDPLSSLLADCPAFGPNLESIVVIALDLNADDAELSVILLDTTLPLLEVLLSAAARPVLDDDDLSAGL
jgi:hypothetical protein